MTVGELLEKIDSAELAEWMAYSELEAEKIKNAGKKSDEPQSVEDKIKAALLPFKGKKDG